VKNLKSVNEDRAKMVRQRNTGRFLQAVAELNEVAPPPDSLAQELENAPGKKGKKGKKRKKGEAATAATNDAAKKAKVNYISFFTRQQTVQSPDYSFLCQSVWKLLSDLMRVCS
jgi:hypothetical protein